MCYIVSLKTGHQNIQGGGASKLKQNDLVNNVKNHHLFGTQETKIGKDNASPDIEGYVKYRSDKLKKNKHVSGGSLIYVKKSMSGGVTLLSKRSNQNGDVMWLRLNKQFFGLEEDILLAYCYIPPNAKQESYDSLKNEISKYMSKGLVTILGDLNSRIGLKPVTHSEVVVKDNQTIVQYLNVPSRNSEDSKINQNGRKLRKMMTEFNFLMANGTSLGDRHGKFTCVAWNGMSTNDVFLFDRKLSSRINYFKVNDSFDWYSDHKSVSLSFRVNVVVGQTGANSKWSDYQKAKLDWNQDKISEFQKILNSESKKSEIKDFCDRNFENTNDAERAFTGIISRALKETFPAMTKNKTRRKKVYSKKNETYSSAVQIAKRSFRKYQREFNLDPNDINRRHKFIRERQKLKKIICFTKKFHKEKRINKVAGLETSDPATFWKEIKSLLNPNNDMTECIDKDDWFNHFNNLLNAPSALHQDKQFLEYVKSSLPRLELYADNIESLNRPITNSEISGCVKDLKKGKSTSLDNIGNEVLTYAYGILENPLNKLYNIIFNLCAFPSQWGDGIVVPLHKKEDRMDTNNYRGIIISSCVGKLFLRIINKRVDKFMSEHDKWSKNQCGFKKDHRTEDNLFLLKTIHEKYVKKQHTKVYVAFVDFSKFFDKINRHIMLYKLLKYGITGNIYHVIKSIYSKTTYSIKVGDKISPAFSATNGLKQGCCLSPILSNIFQNDLHDIFDERCDPISLGSAILNSISWADDLILISKSKEGLQRCLNLLFLYCKKWGLEVNADKTKTMVFSNKLDKTTTFKFNNTPLTNVQSMIYLGFNFSYNGKIKFIMSDRIAKAKKVAGMVLCALRTNKNISTKLALGIYDKQIAPVLMYGCSIWSLPQTGNLIYLENQPENVKVRKQVDDIFREIMGKTIPIEYTKRVGKTQADGSRRILIKLQSFDDKLTILASKNHDYNFSTYVDITSDSEKEYLNFCKSALNISKYASNSATCFELGIKSIDNKMHGLAVKYWLRLSKGTSNYLLNECYRENYCGSFEWTQAIQALLEKNGYGHVWNNPQSVNELSFHKIFQQTLDDQFVQNLLDKIENSTRFEVLQNIVNRECAFTIQKYITLIKNPSIREIFTRLRVDMNTLESSKINVDKSSSRGLCTHCHVKETPFHLLFICDRFSNIRSKSYNSLSSKDHLFDHTRMAIHDLAKYILDLKCPDKSVNECCSMVKSIYDARMKLNDECVDV